MNIPEGCIPYQRLLTWCAKKNLSEFSNQERYPIALEYSDLLNKTLDNLTSLKVKVQMNERISTVPLGNYPLSSISDRVESVGWQQDCYFFLDYESVQLIEKASYLNLNSFFPYCRKRDQIQI